MRHEKLGMDHIRALLRNEEKHIKDVLDAIELNDITSEAVVHHVKCVEDGLKRLRQVA